jgi:NAD+ synthase (glutamine-hydrolysing)
MSHYNVNASVPKTLIQYLIAWVAEAGGLGADVKRALHRVLDTEISPELVPGKQRTEDRVGPYELQDFNLYYILRFGYAPSKVAFLAMHAWKGKYKLPVIRKWLGVFLNRFFRNQFKRSVAPNAPKVGSGGSLSPRGDWRAPSDASATPWLADLANVPAKEG